MDDELHQPQADLTGRRYYQRTFERVLDCVLEWYENIFLSDELAALRTLRSGLPEPAQRLFIRLYLRKPSWLRVSKIEYNDIDDVASAIEALKSHRLLETEPEGMQTYWDLLTVTELKQHTTAASKRRQDLVDTLQSEQAKPQKQAKLCFDSTLSTMTIKRVESKHPREFTGPVVRLECGVVETCNRAVNLFMLQQQIVVGDVATSSPAEALSSAILADLNRRQYPAYTISRSRPVFASRDAYLEYEEALQAESMEEPPVDLIEQWQSHLLRLSDDRDYFLRRFTAAWIYTRIVSRQATLLEQLGCFREANELYDLLLSQNLVCRSYRVHWYTRQMVNSKHLKRPVAEIRAIGERALREDAHLTGCDRWALQQRLLTSKERLRRVRSITMVGRPATDGVTGKKLLFVLPESGGEGSVEQLVLEHWHAQGWSGFETEGRSFAMLFTLLFWDVLFDGHVDNVFQSPCQSAPLDLYVPLAFYYSRKELVDARLVEIAVGSEMATRISRTFVEHYGESAVGSYWETFTVEQLLALARGLGPKAVAMLCRELAMEFSPGGLPDLVIYRQSPECDGAVELKLLEVKSQRDRLSDSQLRWMDLFEGVGVDMLMVRVKSGKRNGLEDAEVECEETVEIEAED